MNQTMMGLNQRSLFMSALIAGVAIGILSKLPVIACVNCLLMAWVWGGAIGAVALYRRYEHQPYLTATQGLVIGAAAGIVGAIVGGIAGLLLGGVNAAIAQTLSSYAGENGVNVPNFVFSTGFTALSIITDIILYAVVGAIGGLIATALIWKAPATVPPPPPYTPPTAGPGM
jgi:hypothetical protein